MGARGAGGDDARPGGSPLDRAGSGRPGPPATSDPGWSCSHDLPRRPTGDPGKPTHNWRAPTGRIPRARIQRGGATAGKNPAAVAVHESNSSVGHPYLTFAAAPACRAIGAHLEPRMAEGGKIPRFGDPVSSGRGRRNFPRTPSVSEGFLGTSRSLGMKSAVPDACALLLEPTIENGVTLAPGGGRGRTGAPPGSPRATRGPKTAAERAGRELRSSSVSEGRVVSLSFLVPHEMLRGWAGGGGAIAVHDLYGTYNPHRPNGPSVNSLPAP